MQTTANAGERRHEAGNAVGGPRPAEERRLIRHRPVRRPDIRFPHFAWIEVEAVGPQARGPTAVRQDDVRTFVEAVVAEKGRIDCLVNNAGGQFIAGADSLTTKGFRAVVETNLVGTFQMMREVYSQSMQEHGGSIVNVTMVTHNGLPRMSHSGAARAGVDNLTKTLAMEWAPSGVRVNSVSPGTINTPLVANVLKLRGTTLDEAGSVYPGGRIGEPHEVANAVLWLASDEATFVTGQNLVVDGGLMSFGRWAEKA